MNRDKFKNNLMNTPKYWLDICARLEFFKNVQVYVIKHSPETELMFVESYSGIDVGKIHSPSI